MIGIARRHIAAVHCFVIFDVPGICSAENENETHMGRMDYKIPREIPGGQRPLSNNR